VSVGIMIWTLVTASGANKALTVCVETSQSVTLGK